MSNATLEREGRSAQDVRHAPNSPTNSFDHQSLDNDPQRSLAHAAQRRLLRTQTERASREYVNEDDLHEHERKRADKLAKERREETEVVKPEMVNLAQHTETEPHRQTQAKLKDYEKMLGAHLAKAGQLEVGDTLYTREAALRGDYGEHIKRAVSEMDKRFWQLKDEMLGRAERGAVGRMYAGAGHISTAELEYLRNKYPHLMTVSNVVNELSDLHHYVVREHAYQRMSWLAYQGCKARGFCSQVQNFLKGMGESLGLGKIAAGLEALGEAGVHLLKGDLNAAGAAWQQAGQAISGGWILFTEFTGIADLARAGESCVRLLRGEGSWLEFGMNLGFAAWAVWDMCTFGSTALGRMAAKSALRQGAKPAFREGVQQIGQALGSDLAQDLAADQALEAAVVLAQSQLKNGGQELAEDVGLQVAAGKIASPQAAKEAMEQGAHRLTEQALKPMMNIVEDRVAKRVYQSAKQGFKDLPESALQHLPYNVRQGVKRVMSGEIKDQAALNLIQEQLKAGMMNQLRSGLRSTQQRLRRSLLEGVQEGIGALKKNKNIHLTDEMVDAMEAGAKQGFNRAFHEGMERAVREGIEQAMKLLRKDHRRRYSPGRSALTRTLVQHIPGLDAVCMAGVAAQAWSLCDFGYVEQIRRERDDSKRKDTY